LAGSPLRPNSGEFGYSEVGYSEVGYSEVGYSEFGYSEVGYSELGDGPDFGGIANSGILAGQVSHRGNDRSEPTG
jgi:hypothetical protein